MPQESGIVEKESQVQRGTVPGGVGREESLTEGHSSVRASVISTRRSY